MKNIGLKLGAALSVSCIVAAFGYTLMTTSCVRDNQVAVTTDAAVVTSTVSTSTITQ